MSLFRVIKYSSLLFFLNKYRGRLFRVIAVLLFAGVTSLLYQDVADYLHREHPGAVIYALAAKIIIVYGALLFVLWQFRPQAESSPDAPPDTPPSPSADRLSALEDIDGKEQLRSRYDRILEGERK